MSTVFEAITKRKSIRRYETTPIEKDKLNTLLEAARLAPTACNMQDFRFIMVDDPEIKNKVAEAMGQSFGKGAAAILVGCGLKNSEEMLCGQKRNVVDLSIATSFVILEAYELGLGACWIGNFQTAPVIEALNISEDMIPITMVTLGYPAEDPAGKPRKPIDCVVAYNQF